MKKKIMIKVIFIIFVSVFFINKVNADYECAYDFSHNNILGLTQELTKTLKVNTEAKKIETDSFYFGSTSNTFEIADKYADSKYTDEYLIDEYMNGSCPNKVYACVALAQHSTKYILIMNPSLITEFPKKNGYSTYKNYIFRQEECDVANYNEDKSTGKPLDVKFECDSFNELFYGNEKKSIKGLSELYCKSREEGCSPDKIEEYKKRKSEISHFCSSIVSYADYVNPCLQDCLSLSDLISDIEGQSPTYDCVFSDRLMAWVDNILKWIKYILPVIVIVLGIIDFIKAIAEEKDDEMKKAQGRFVKRLIAAALAFLIPFIIQFILEKFGFISDSCGLW